MSDTQKDDLLIQYAAIVAALLEQQVRQSQDSTPKKRSLGQSLLEPSVLAALLTVVIGGLFGAWITHIFQEKAKTRESQQIQLNREREFELLWLKSRGDQALIAYQQYLDSERGVVQRAYSLIGEVVSASDRVVGMARPAFRRTTSEKQMSDIRTSYNETKAKWRSQNQELILLMSYYHPKQKSILETWKLVQDSVSAYMENARELDDKYRMRSDAPTEQENKAREEKYNSLLSNLDKLTQLLEETRLYAWRGYESPRAMLEMMQSSPVTPAPSPAVNTK